MEEIEVSAKTVDEAVKKALEQLGLSEDEVEVTVIKKGRSGFLGWGAEESRVLVRPLQHVEEVKPPIDFVSPEAFPGEPMVIVREVLEELLTLMKIDAQIEMEESSPMEDGSPVSINITGDTPGILIGRWGQTLASLQYIVSIITAHRLKRRVQIIIDVDGYKRRRYQALSDMAVRLAQKVNDTGKSMMLQPMSAGERRAVHLALRDNPLVITQSVGEGESRKVVIMAKKALT